MKVKFPLTSPKEETTSMTIGKIWIKGKNEIHLEADDHLIEMMLSDVLAMDIRVGDTVDFEGDECKGVDLAQRPQEAMPFTLEEDVSRKTKKVRNGNSKAKVDN